MGVWHRPTEERVVDFQPPPYSEHWHYAEYVTILASDDKKKEFGISECELDLPDHGSKSLADLKVSPYYDAELRRRRFTGQLAAKAPLAVHSEVKSTSVSHRRLHSKDSIERPQSSKKSWLRSLKKKHPYKPSKKPSITSLTNPGPKFIAIPIPTKPPRLSNKILLSDDTIRLSDLQGPNRLKPSTFKITLETTLLENRPYTICSNILRRDQDQDVEATLSSFEVFDIETGYILSEKPATATPRARQNPSSNSPEIQPSGTITRTTCTELSPRRPSHLRIISHPSFSKSSTQRLFSGLRIRNPNLLVGRRLGLRLRLRGEVALWSAKMMGEVFGFAESVRGWPDVYYGRELVVRCSDGEEGEEGGGWAEFRVVE